MHFCFLFVYVMYLNIASYLYGKQLKSKFGNKVICVHLNRLLSGDVPMPPPYDIYISQLVWFVRCCTSVLDFHSKNLQITSKLCISTGLQKSQASKNIWKVLHVILWCVAQILWILDSRICFWRNISPRLLRWYYLQTKEGQRYSEFCLENS